MEMRTSPLGKLIEIALAVGYVIGNSLLAALVVFGSGLRPADRLLELDDLAWPRPLCRRRNGGIPDLCTVTAWASVKEF